MSIYFTRKSETFLFYSLLSYFRKKKKQNKTKTKTHKTKQNKTKQNVSARNKTAWRPKPVSLPSGHLSSSTLFNFFRRKAWHTFLWTFSALFFLLKPRICRFSRVYCIFYTWENKKTCSYEQYEKDSARLFPARLNGCTHKRGFLLIVDISRLLLINLPPNQLMKITITSKRRIYWRY